MLVMMIGETIKLDMGRASIRMEQWMKECSKIVDSIKVRGGKLFMREDINLLSSRMDKDVSDYS